MKKYIFSFLLIGSGLFACKDSNDVEINQLASLNTAGIYEGTFSHYSPDGNKKSANVSVTLNSDGSYSSSSGENYFPAGGSGSYTIIGKTAKFDNPNFYTANFDWNYILSGEYTIAQKDKSLILTKTTEDKNIYEYDLEKK